MLGMVGRLSWLSRLFFNGTIAKQLILLLQQVRGLTVLHVKLKVKGTCIAQLAIYLQLQQCCVSQTGDSVQPRPQPIPRTHGLWTCRHVVICIRACSMALHPVTYVVTWITTLLPIPGGMEG